MVFVVAVVSVHVAVVYRLLTAVVVLGVLDCVFSVLAFVRRFVVVYCLCVSHERFFVAVVLAAELVLAEYFGFDFGFAVVRVFAFAFAFAPCRSVANYVSAALTA